MHFSPKHSRHAQLLTVLATLGLWISGAYGVTAQFELRPAAGKDNVLDINNPADKALPLELWVTLSNGSLPGGVLGYSVYLKPSVGGVISFDTASYQNAVAFDAPLVNGTDNSSLSGEFGRGVSKWPAVPFSLGSTKLATFSVTAIAPGEVSYSFQNAPPVRQWGFDFDNLTTATLAAASPAVTITVIPEPGVAAMVLLSMAGLTRRRRPAAV